MHHDQWPTIARWAANGAVNEDKLAEELRDALLRFAPTKNEHVDNGCSHVRSVLCDLIDALDEVDAAAEYYERTGSTRRSVVAVQALGVCRRLGRRHASASTHKGDCGAEHAHWGDRRRPSDHRGGVGPLPDG